ncbi:MAG: EAL domain-containing protein [Gallionella sp.]
MKASVPPNETLRLETLLSYKVLDTPTEQDFDDLVLLAQEICQTPIAAITLIDQDRQWFKSIAGFEVSETPREISFCAHTILHADELLLVKDLLLDKRFSDNPFVTTEPYIRFYAGAPLVAPNGCALGTLCVFDSVPRDLSEGQIIALRTLSHNVMAKLELRRTIEAFKQSQQALTELNDSLKQKVDSATSKLQQEVAERTESEMKFRQLSENIQEVFWVTDVTKGEMQYVSPAYEQVWGRTLKSLYDTPQNWLEAIHSEDRQRIIEAATTKQAAGLYDEEYRIVRPDGEIRWIWDRAFPVRDNEGNVYRIVGIAEDISERKKVESDLRIHAAAFETQESLLITDADGVIQRVNQAFTDITGYSVEDAVGKTPSILKSERHDDNFYQELSATLKRTGHWSGEIWNRRKNGDIYPAWLNISCVKGGEGAISHYVGSHIDITERKIAEEKIENLAYYDSLTKLPNRRLLLERLQRAVIASTRSGKSGALLFIDLDHFKMLNDTLGHHIGDLLLQQVAQRLKSCVREGDTVSRLGGDEFVVMLENLSDQTIETAAVAETASKKILAYLGKPYQLADHECRSTPSIGIAIFSDSQLPIAELMKQADIAMYHAKKVGRNTVRFFDSKMQVAINEHASLEKELRHAIEQQQFRLEYQIQVDEMRRAIGAEALIRWAHPDRGLLAPLHFISLAEETGLILEIGKWVLETACAQLKAWQQDDLTRELVLAINVSAKQFHQPDFVAQVQEAVEQYNIDPKLLKLELTESLMLESIDVSIATMNALNKIGIKLSLDDFGTGYSSLQYLKILPLEQLKIDQSFVRDLDRSSSDKAIVKTIIAMAESLELDVIAEGVDEDIQRKILLENGCKYFQGYLYSKPVSIEQFEKLLSELERQ